MNADRHGTGATDQQGKLRLRAKRAITCDTPCLVPNVPQAARLPRRMLFSRPITLHCKVLFAFWSLLILLQFLFPGFEARGLFAGLIPGLWVMALVQVPMEFAYEHTLIALICMTALCGYLVFLCSWLMDKAGIRKKSWILFAAFTLAGALLFSSRGSSYGDWQRSSAIQQAVNSPELNYQPTRSDYNRTILIPRTIAGGLWGFYACAMLFGLFAVSKILWRSARSNFQHGGAGGTGPSKPLTV